MATSKKTDVAVAATALIASPDVRTLTFDDAAASLAGALQLDLQASPDVRTERAIQAYNMATRHMVEAGLLLLSVRSEVGPEAFSAVLEERGMAKQRASELMRGAALVARLGGDERDRVLAMHKSKVVLLANASPAVVEAVLEDDEIDVDLLTVRALRERVRDLEAATTDLTVQRDTAEAEAEGLRKQVKRGLPDRQDGVPLVVADLRAEIVALGKKAGLALDGFHALASDLQALVGTDAAHEWADATVRLAAAQLSALAVQLNGELRYYATALPGEDLTPASRSYLTKQEVIEAAKVCAELTQVHDYERALREWEREQQRPRGKGRPRAKPEAPEAQS